MPNIEGLLPALPPVLPLPRFLVGELVEGGNPLSFEELLGLEKKYGSWAARLAHVFGTDYPSIERIAKGLSERILKKF